MCHTIIFIQVFQFFRTFITGDIIPSILNIDLFNRGHAIKCYVLPKKKKTCNKYYHSNINLNINKIYFFALTCSFSIFINFKISNSVLFILEISLDQGLYVIATLTQSSCLFHQGSIWILQDYIDI